MLPVQMNLVENETPKVRNGENVSPVASVMAEEVSDAKTHAGNQAAAADAMYAAFVWLFGSGCY
jgi:hypothetical protein